MTAYLTRSPVLHTDRLTLRLPGAQDAGPLQAFMASDRAQFVGGPKAAHETWRSLAMMIGHWMLRGHGLYMFCRRGSDTAIGMAGPFSPEGWPEPELAWSVIDPSEEGKGLAFEAIQAVRAHVFGGLGWCTAVSYVNPANTRSIALAKRLGCTLDPAAKLPDLPEWEGTLTFRHPGPEALA